TETDPEGSGRREVPLTPLHAAGIVGMWEAEGQGRVGVEVYYTGRQQLEENPYRTTSRPYVVTGVLVERRFGRARLFLNAENLLDTRQTRYDPLVLPERSPEGRWTTDVWAPLEGRVFNAGIGYEFWRQRTRVHRALAGDRRSNRDAPAESGRCELRSRSAQGRTGANGMRRRVARTVCHPRGQGERGREGGGGCPTEPR